MAEGKSGSKEKRDPGFTGQKLAEIAKKHSREAFYALDDPLELAIFSVLVELMRELAEAKMIERHKTPKHQEG